MDLVGWLVATLWRKREKRETFLLIATPVLDKLPITFNFGSVEALKPSFVGRLARVGKERPGFFDIFDFGTTVLLMRSTACKNCF